MYECGNVERVMTPAQWKLVCKFMFCVIYAMNRYWLPKVLRDNKSNSSWSLEFELHEEIQ